MEVTMNGPILVEADPVIETSMNGKRWHFTKKWDIRDHLNNKESLVIQRMMKERSNLYHSWPNDFKLLRHYTYFSVNSKATPCK